MLTGSRIECVRDATTHQAPSVGRRAQSQGASSVVRDSLVEGFVGGPNTDDAESARLSIDGRRSSSGFLDGLSADNAEADGQDSEEEKAEHGDD